MCQKLRGVYFFLKGRQVLQAAGHQLPLGALALSVLLSSTSPAFLVCFFAQFLIEFCDINVLSFQSLYNLLVFFLPLLDLL